MNMYASARFVMAKRIHQMKWRFRVFNIVLGADRSWIGVKPFELYKYMQSLQKSIKNKRYLTKKHYTQEKINRLFVK